MLVSTTFLTDTAFLNLELVGSLDPQDSRVGLSCDSRALGIQETEPSTSTACGMYRYEGTVPEPWLSRCRSPAGATANQRH